MMELNTHSLRRLLSLAVVFALCAGLCILPASAGTVNTQYSVVSGGMSHTVALKGDGTVWAWGANSSGQLGADKEVQSSSTPIQVEGLSPAISVVAGFHFSAALLSDGTVAVWGGGTFKPACIPGLTGVTAIDAGQIDLLALRSDGTVWQWSSVNGLRQVSGLTNISVVSAGGGHCLALSHTGEVYAWGSNNSNGQLGLGNTAGQDVPQRISGLIDIVDISAGYSHSLAVDFDGTVYAWGSNTYGQLGTEDVTENTVPVVVPTVKKAVQVSAGQDSSMALTSNGSIYTWGYGEFGQLGVSNTISRSRPSTLNLSGLGTPVVIASGAYHNLLVNNRGAVYAWGRNRDGQLGTGKNTNRDTPQRIVSLVQSGNYKPDRYQVTVLNGLHSWASAEVSTLYKANLISPQMWGEYSRNITRAEFAHLLVNVYGQVKKIDITPSKTANFQDIAGHPLEQDILKAYNLGLLNGRSDTEFAPDANLTREQAAKLLCELVNRMQGVYYVPSQNITLSYYDDADLISGWAKHYVDFAHKQNIMQGTGSKFDPKGYMTREQALIVVSRLMTRYGWTH